MYHCIIVYKSDLRKIAKELSITLFAAISILPFVTRSFTSIKSQIENLLPALDIYYYQRVFSLNRDYFQLGNMYVDSVSFQQREINILSIGEVVQKYVFHLLGNRIILTYFLFSLVMIFLWIFLIERLIAYDYPQSFSKNVLFTSSLLVIFFGNTNLINSDNYLFARIVSPQISVFLWLIGLVLLNRIVITKESKTLEYKYLIQFSLLLFVASFTYLFTFISLFGTSIVVFSFLAIQKKYRDLVWFLAFTLISILPFMVLNFNQSKEERFQDASARLGLVKYHFPGSLTTILISLGIIFAITMHKHFITKKLPYSNLERVLVISSIGLILASQSNIVTGKEIQFYHFSLFAKMNLMIYFILIASRITFRKFQNKIVKYRVILIVFLPIILILNSSKGVILPLIYDNRVSSSIEFLNQYSSKKKLIVDVANLQNVFPIYSEAKLLYQSDITSYGFSNLEVLDRAYISAGCPNKISERLQSELEVYRALAIYTKGKALENYLKYFYLDKYFASFYIPTLDRALKERRIIQSEINNYLITANKTDCVSLAKTYGIDSIIFDKKSQWYSIVIDNNLPVISFTFQGLSLYEYKL